jgi:predicted ATPase/DNA-binding XRE family transcriptional regulator
LEGLCLVHRCVFISSFQFPKAVEMESLNSFGKWLKRRRRQLGLTQQALADCASCSVITIRKFESDARRPSRQLAELLADCLAFPPDERQFFIEFARGTARSDRPVIPQRPAGVETAYALPQPQTEFIGREEELKRIFDLLSDPACHLLTLVGPGGIGKTRLALAAAETFTETKAHKVVFVPLSGVAQPGLIPQAIAYHLGFSLNGPEDPAVQLSRYLSDKQRLLVLDNFEHLLEGAEVIAIWLGQAPQVKILATSRERLNLVEEWLYPVHGFSNAEQGAALFVQSARRLRPDFALTGQENAVADICQLVGGMPLAIELAAGWSVLLSAEQIADQLRKGFDFLSTSLRNVPQRHRSLRRLFDQTWQLLDAPGQAILMRLSVFRGGFALEQAALVAGASLAGLLDLVNKSLLDASYKGRFDLHELTRQYAVEKLRSSGDEQATRELHFQAYLALAESAEPRLYGPEAAAWFHRLEEEGANFQAALAWELDSAKSGSALRLVNSLWWFWFRRGYWREAETWIAAALEQESASGSLPGCRARLNLSTLIALQGRYEEAAPHLVQAMETARRLGDAEATAATLIVYGQAVQDVDQALAIFGEAEAFWEQATDRQKPWVLAHLHYLIGDRLRESGRLVQAAARYEQSLALYRQAGNVDSIAYPLGSLGKIALHAGQLQAAREKFSESVALSRRIANRQGLADWLAPLGMTIFYIGDGVQAESYLQESLTFHNETGNRRGQAEVLTCLALVSLERQEIAAQYLHTGLSTYRELVQQVNQASRAFSTSEGLSPGLVDCFYVAALVAFAQGQNERAFRLLSAADRFQQQMGVALDLPLQEMIRAARSQAASLSPEAWPSTTEEEIGSLEDALRYAIN